MRERLRGWKATFAKLATISFLAIASDAASGLLFRMSTLMCLASDYFVRDLPGQPPDSHVVMHAGYAFPVGK